MPNWCYNTLEITGKAEALRDLKEMMVGKSFGDNKEHIFDFNKVLPYPQKFLDIDNIFREYLKNNPKDYANCPRDGYNNGGYEWCWDNWGTKWPAVDVSLDSDVDHEGNLLDLFYKFNTAWSPPIPIIKELGKIFPELKFEMEYSDECDEFKGTLIVEGDEVSDIWEDYNGKTHSG